MENFYTNTATMMEINDDYINTLIQKHSTPSNQDFGAIIKKAQSFKGLNHEEVAALLFCNDPKIIEQIFSTARSIKNEIYGDRIVMFAPLYVSDYCVNECDYCGYKHSNEFKRTKLDMDALRAQARNLEKMGHKRLALEAGEDKQNCDINYILECIKTLYSERLENGEIRRINVNIAATTVENYQKLKQANIGTYILFQETYDKKAYKDHHKKGPKSNYQYHLTAFDRAMQGGIDDVGGGVLFGLGNPYFDTLAMIMHTEYLDSTYGAGFHTISIPRLCKAQGMDLDAFPNIIDDELFLKIVAILRLAVPYTGMIVSTREDEKMRKALIDIGISQMSGGSQAEVGGYSDETESFNQFELSDERTADDIIRWLMGQDLIPSFCTACYRSGRTGDRFMELAKSGNIKNVCLPNALMTLAEYMYDYGDESFRAQAEPLIQSKIQNITNEKMRKLTAHNLELIKNGTRDLYV